MTGTARPGPRALLIQDRSRATRRRLVDAAAARWTADGYDEVSVADVCATAGVAKGSFYFHFRSKEDLVVELLTTALRDATTDVATAGAGTGAETPSLRAVTAAVAEQVAPLPRSLVGRAAAEALRSGAGDGAPWATAIASLLPGAGAVAPDTGAVVGAVVLDTIRGWAATDAPVRRRGLAAALLARLGLVARGPAGPPAISGPAGAASGGTR
ncbi:MAG: TetR/AcrR family transcriptional regulator [Acidimicrobiales bacterium]|nr:TetR/AcrR family transcriptional regulator [Acidimicrobiales bacterium]